MVPAACKTAAATPLLKKQNCDVNILSDFYLISNLPFLAKILEAVVVAQLNKHLIEKNNCTWFVRDRSLLVYVLSY